MALKDTWTPKTEFIDDATAADINEVAAAVIKIEEEGVSGGGGMTETDVEDYIKENVIEPKGILLPSGNEGIIAQTWDDYQIRSSPKTLGYIINNDMMTEEKVREVLAGPIDVGYMNINPTGRINTPVIYINDGVPDWRGLIQYDENGGEITMEQTLATKANDMKLLYTKKLTADDGNVSFIEFLPETPLKKIYVYTFCPKDTTANTNKLFFKFGSGSYITDSVGHANIATDSAMWGIKELDLEQHKHLAHANNIKSGYPGSLQSRNILYPYSGNNTFWTAIYDTSTFEVKNLLSGIKFSTNSESVYFPLDTIMMVWGC